MKLKAQLLISWATAIAFFVMSAGQYLEARTLKKQIEKDTARITGLQAARAREVAAANGAAFALQQEVGDLQQRLASDSAQWAQRLSSMNRELADAGIALRQATRAIVQVEDRFTAHLESEVLEDGVEVWSAFLEKGPFQMPVQVFPETRDITIDLFGTLPITLAQSELLDGTIAVTAFSDFESITVSDVQLLVQPVERDSGGGIGWKKVTLFGGVAFGLGAWLGSR